MKKESIRYSKLKIARFIFVAASITLAPVAFIFIAPSVFETKAKSLSDIAMVYGFFGAMSLFGMNLLAYIWFKLKTSQAAVTLNEKGITSNVTGLTSKFIPWSEVVSASAMHIGKGHISIAVATKESELQYKNKTSRAGFSQSPHELLINPLLLDKDVEYVVDAINQQIKHYNDADPSVGLGEHSLETYVNKVA